MKSRKHPRPPNRPTVSQAKPSSSKPPAPLPSDRAVTLDDLLRRAAPVSEAMRELAFLALDDAQRLEYGRTIDSTRVLAAAIPFAAGAYAVFDRLAPKERARVLGASPAMVDLLVHEIAALQACKTAFDARSAQREVDRAGRRASARKTAREAITLRDQVYSALRSVTRPHERDALDVALGTAGTPADLALGMRRVAAMLRTRLRAATEAQREALADLGLTLATAQALEEAATATLAADAEAAGPPPQTRVTQRELDLADGAVVHLVGVLYRAFREASASLPTLVVPPLGELTRFFNRPTKPRVPPPAPAPPA